MHKHKRPVYMAIVPQNVLYQKPRTQQSNLPFHLPASPKRNLSRSAEIALIMRIRSCLSRVSSFARSNVANSLRNALHLLSTHPFPPIHSLKMGCGMSTPSTSANYDYYHTRGYSSAKAYRSSREIAARQRASNDSAVRRRTENVARIQQQKRKEYDVYKKHRVVGRDGQHYF